MKDSNSKGEEMSFDEKFLLRHMISEKEEGLVQTLNQVSDQLVREFANENLVVLQSLKGKLTKEGFL